MIRCGAGGDSRGTHSAWSPVRLRASFLEPGLCVLPRTRLGELRKITLPRTWLNKGPVRQPEEPPESAASL